MDERVAAENQRYLAELGPEAHEVVRRLGKRGWYPERIDLATHAITWSSALGIAPPETIEAESWEDGLAEAIQRLR